MGKIDPILKMLFVGMIFGAACLFAAETFFNSDGQVFQVFAGLTTGFASALLLRVRPPDKNPPIADPQSVSTTTVTQETVEAPEASK